MIYLLLLTFNSFIALWQFVSGNSSSLHFSPPALLPNYLLPLQTTTYDKRSVAAAAANPSIGHIVASQRVLWEAQTHSHSIPRADTLQKPNSDPSVIESLQSHKHFCLISSSRSPISSPCRAKSNSQMQIVTIHELLYFITPSSSAGGGSSPPTRNNSG